MIGRKEYIIAAIGAFGAIMAALSPEIYSSLQGRNDDDSAQVERVDRREIIDLSGAWNDTDSRLVVEAMVSDALSGPWINEHVSATNRKPAIIVGTVHNLSHEHIDTRAIVADIQRSLVNSGLVHFVASRSERNEIRNERHDQASNAEESSRKLPGNELAADFMMQGQINSLIDSEPDKQVRFYQVDLALLSMTDNRKVWLGQKKIKKYVTHSAPSN